MLIVVQSIHNKRLGVVDDKTQKVIVPINYQNIIIQKGGIIAQQPENGLWTAFSMGSVPYIKNCKNILFLENNLMLISGNNNMCYIYNCTTKSYLTNIAFEAVLVFIGSSKQAIPFSSVTNIANIISTTDYNKFGAHFESLLCGRINGNWGIINIDNGSVFANFIYKTMVHCTGKQIGARDANGNTITL